MDVSPASLDALLNAALLHFLQGHTNLRFRHGVASGLASAVNALIERRIPLPGSPSAKQAQHLADEGYVPLGQVLTADDVRKVVAHFEQRPCFNGPVPAMSDRVARRVGEGAERFRDGSFALAEVIAAPGLLELANRPEIVAVAEAYLGCTPTLYSLHAQWSFAGPGASASMPWFQRDLDDYKFCTLVMYLTDVGPQSGAHVFVRRSHRVDLAEAILREANGRDGRFDRKPSIETLYPATESEAQDRLYAEIFSGLIDTITGPAGFAFIADTSGLHKEMPMTAGRRLMVCARYGLYRNTYTAIMGDVAVPPSAVGSRLAGDPRTVYINRCLVRDVA